MRSLLSPALPLHALPSQPCAPVSALCSLSIPLAAQAIAASPAGLSGPFVVGGVASVLGVALAFTQLYSPAEIEALRKFSPAARARDRWRRLREQHAPAAASEAGRVADDERWPTIMVIISVAVLSSLLNATPAVLLALGPMASIGLGTEAFGVILMLMGLSGLLTQVTLFRRLHQRFGLYTTGAMGGVCSAMAAMAFLCVGRLSACVPASATTASASTACAVANASLVDIVCLAIGSVCFASGFILCNSCVSPVLVQSATSRTTGQVRPEPHADRRFLTRPRTQLREWCYACNSRTLGARFWCYACNSRTLGARFWRRSLLAAPASAASLSPDRVPCARAVRWWDSARWVPLSAVQLGRRRGASSCERPT